MRKVLEEDGLVCGIQLHQRRRPRIFQQLLISGQKPQSLQQILVIHVIKSPRRHDVVECGDGWILEVIDACLLKSFCKSGIHGWIEGVVATIPVIEDPVGVLAAVREPNGVGAGEGDEIADGESLGGEEVYDGVDGGVGAGEVGLDHCGGGGEGVLAAEADRIEGAAEHGDEISSGDREDVGAGDDPGAVELEGGLGADDDVEGIAGEGEVDVGVALGVGVKVVGGDEGGGVTTGDEAVVEKEAEDASAGGGAVDLLGGDDVGDDVVDVGAGGVVVVDGELSGGGGGGGEKEEEDEERPRH